MEGFLIGLDVGTSSVKAGLFDVQGRLIVRASAPLSLYSPAPGWAEQEPLDWWHGSVRVLSEIFRQVDPTEVLAVGLSGQCPGHTLVGNDGKSLGRAIIWRDQRAVEEAAWLQEKITPEQAMAWVGTPALGDATCPPARLLWLKRHRNELWKKVSCVLQPKDFIALQLTGECATDRHSAYCLANPEAGFYHPDYFDLLEISIDKMPALLDPTQIVGEVTPEAAEITGLKAGTKVIIGTIDAYCDNLAGGVLCQGRAVDVAGTSEIVSLQIERAVFADGVYAAKIGDAGAFLCGPTQAGGETLRWLARSFHVGNGVSIPFEQMEQEAASVEAGSEGLVFLPYLNGERAPLWDADARGAFVGLTFIHDRRHFTRAVYESIAFAVKHILEVAEAATGEKAQDVVVCGGGSRSAFWNKLKADVLQRPIRPARVSETGCLGAVILASVGVKVYVTLREACEQMVNYQDTISPDPRLAPVYEDQYQYYRHLYGALRPLFTKSGYRDKKEE